MKFEGAIFDLDGTLLDSMPVWDSVGADYLQSQGIMPHSDLFERIKLMTLRQAAEHFQIEYGLSLSVAEIENGINGLIEAFYRNTAQAKPGAPAFLRRLHGLGTKMCVVTATDKYLTEAALARLGLLGLFESVITCGDFGSGKDTPAIFEYALGTLGTPKALTPVFEDAIHAAKTAKNAQFPVVAVYDKSFAACEEALKALADIYIYSFDEMGEYFV